MSINHATRPYPSHFAAQRCKRCRRVTATVYLEAYRLSRSENYRRYTVGAYCESCAGHVIEEAAEREHRKPPRR